MIGLVLVTHGGLAAEFKAAAEHIRGPQAQLAVVRIDAEDDMEERRNEIAAAVAACDSGQGVIILSDMFGGTPSNLAISLLSNTVEVIAGINLPMLMKLVEVRKTHSLTASVQAAQESGRKYILVASRQLGAAA